MRCGTRYFGKHGTRSNCKTNRDYRIPNKTNANIAKTIRKNHDENQCIAHG